MSSPSPDPTQSPNSPVTTNPTNKTRNKRKRNKDKNKNKNPNPNRNWLELPEDLWLSIFSKLVTYDILINVQNVCSLFREICKQPSIFKSVNVFLPNPFKSNNYRDSILSMIRHAVDRSHGGLVYVFLDYVDFDTLMYLIDRSCNLKHLRLGRNVDISNEELIKAIEKVPTLEEVQLMLKFSWKTVQAVGRKCSSLKSFSLVNAMPRSCLPYNADALAIAKNMPHLRHLQLIGNAMSNRGLKAILNRCTRLESLDLYECFHIDLSGYLGRRCRKLKPSRCNDNSCKDYGRMAYDEEYQSRFAYDSDYACSDHADYSDDDSYSYDYLDYDDFTISDVVPRRRR